MFEDSWSNRTRPCGRNWWRGLAELAGVTTVGYAGDERTAVAWLTDPANDWDIAVVDLHLGDKAQALAALSSGRFPPANPLVEPPRSTFAALFGT